MDSYLKSAMRWIGAAANAALALAFLYAALRLYGYGAASLSSSGGLPGLDLGLLREPSLLFGSVAAFLTEPGAAARAVGYVMAWLCFIAAAGCGWMALLGGRWLYNALARTV